MTAPAIEPSGEWLYAKEIAAKYRIPVQTIWRLTREGRLTPRAITSKVRLYNTAEVERDLGLTTDAGK